MKDAAPKRRKGKLAWLAVAFTAIATVVMGFVAIGPDDDSGGNFSQMTGFAEHFAAFPPSAELPDERTQQLLERHRPRFHLPAGHAGLISFYDDYIAQGVLRAAGGTVISEAVTPELLNRHKHDPLVGFEHRALPSKRSSAVVFGRLDRDSVHFTPAGPQEFTFLTYHAVFRESGLAAGTDGWQTLLTSLVGDIDDWHQLDHYTAVTLILDDRETPVALLLQQHNNQRTYLLGEGYVLPADGRPAVDVAIRSNELYPHQPGRQRHKVVRFPGPEEMKYLLGLTGRPLMTADDITDPQREAAYELRFLPPIDAFYTFKGYLGERRLMPGRDGPPGADYNTLPFLKPWGRQMLVGYWRPGNRGDGRRLLKALDSSDWIMSMIGQQAEVFAANLACARKRGTECAFE